MSDWHVGRAWTGHLIEDACPCPKAPCGLAISTPGVTCPEHNPADWIDSKTIRQSHPASDCPAMKEEAMTDDTTTENETTDEGDVVETAEEREPAPPASPSGVSRPEESPNLVARGGWCAPSDSLFPEVTVSRGGIAFSFAPPKPLEEYTKKELRAEVERLREARDRLQTSLHTERRRSRKARRKVNRLLKIIEGLA